MPGAVTGSGGCMAIAQQRRVVGGGTDKGIEEESLGRRYGRGADGGREGVKRATASETESASAGTCRRAPWDALRPLWKVVLVSVRDEGGLLRAPRGLGRFAVFVWLARGEHYRCHGEGVPEIGVVIRVHVLFRRVANYLCGPVVSYRT